MGMDAVLSLPSLPSVEFLSHRQPFAGFSLSRYGGFSDRTRKRRVAVVLGAAGASNNNFEGANSDSKIGHVHTSKDCKLDQLSRDNRLRPLQRRLDSQSAGTSMKTDATPGNPAPAASDAFNSSASNGQERRTNPLSSSDKAFDLDLACKGGSIAGVDMPFSLRMLKKKQKGNSKSSLTSGLAGVGNSLLNAFSSTVFMVRTLQSHMFHIREHFFEQEIEGLLNQVHREMHTSFIWLFQQIFSCTPELMVLVMVLLADFTVFSMASNLPLSDMVSPASPPLAVISSFANPDVSLLNGQHAGIGLGSFLKKPLMSSPPLTDNSNNDLDEIHGGGWFGNGGKRGHVIAGGADGDPDPKYSMSLNTAVYSADDNMPAELSSIAAASVAQQELPANEAEPPSMMDSCSVEDLSPSDYSAMEAAIAFEELSISENSNDEGPLVSTSNAFDDDVQASSDRKNTENNTPLSLDHDVMRNLVAPLTVAIEDDNYICYDRTDLDYQYALSSDSMNSMLLANYAQFLFLVRKDHDRAEELFRRAVVCDPLDGDAIGRFACFLWLARRNLAAAEKAYKTAIRVDPVNTYHAANYAHFLWNSCQ